MFGKKLISALAALIIMSGSSMAIGKRVDSMAPYNIFSDKLIFDTEKLASIVLAQNDKSTPQENDITESESETDESKAAADEEKKSSDEASKPLEPFVPSEKIPGEQAVDFPADI